MCQGGVTILAGRGNANEVDLSANAISQILFDSNKYVAILLDKSYSMRLQVYWILQHMKKEKEINDGGAIANTTVTDSAFVRSAEERLYVTPIHRIANCDDYTVDSAIQSLDRLNRVGKRDIVVLNFKIFNSAKNADEFKKFVDNLLQMKKYAQTNNCPIIVNTHCDTPFYEWRVLHQLVGDNVQLIQFFEEEDKLGLNFFGGKNDGKVCDVTYDSETRRFNLID